MSNMNLKDYKFNVGDEVITTEGVRGKITSICTCSECQKRGFYEPFWVAEDRRDEFSKCIDKFTASCGFVGFYKIGEYRFNDFDKGEVLRNMGDCETELRRLKKQLKLIEELEKESANQIDTEVYKYTAIFDDSCAGWSKDPMMNKIFLLQQQNYADYRLRAIGHLFLNDVYDMLGIPRTSAGQRVGWIYDPEDPCRSNFVSFGIFDDRNADFVRCTLKFNVDGEIWEDL